MGLGLELGLRLGGGGLLNAPALDLHFASSLALPASITFSRASSGTYFDSNGVLQTAATNAARFGYLFNGPSWVSRGLFIEEQRTNYAIRNSEFDNAAWTKNDATVVANSGVSPDGTTNADLIYPSSSGANRGVERLTSGLPGSTSTFTSFFLKAAGKSWVMVGHTGGQPGVYFNLSNGTIGTVDGTGTVSARIENCGNGWYRCTVVRTTTGASSFWNYFRIVDANGSLNVTPNGTDGVLAYGAQLGIGLFETSPIVTTSSSVVRSADVAAISGSNFSSFFNSSEGTIVVEGTSIGVGVCPLVSFDDNTANQSMILGTSGTDPIFAVTDGGSAQCSLDGGTITAGTQFKFAAAYKANDFAACLNGGAVQTDASGTIPTVDRMRLGCDQAGNYLNGFISRVRYYRTRLTNAQLQELTA